MKRIDRETVQRILDAADIVEVVSDFVSLKKRGANYVGLCPFHNERTPSFSVSRTKGICKCFSCGKGGSPVGFVMEHEQMSYNEALRYLAKKYHIEIKEHEMTDAERDEASERESMMAVNDFALKHFQSNLADTADGRDIGLAYFRERGINDAMIKRFQLGYALDKADDLLKAALLKGFTEKYLLSTGLCSRSDRGSVYDRFRGRVIYPVFTVSGRVVAFGGRTLRTDKSMAKYVNSPESAIYRKSYELYGLYQAKSAITKQDKCILVEGYMDVISMHQIGIENVVASSGTSLTEGQIRLIHRFTQNVTVIYDSDAAGIKASLRGIDMLLAEGLNIKVLLLPDGDDPDSFAQSHSLAEVQAYMDENETDFIRFKTRILLDEAGNDPIERSRVINSIVKSISVIPDTVTRAVYISECSRAFDIEEKVLTLQMNKCMADNVEKAQKAAQQEQQRRHFEDIEQRNAAGREGRHAGAEAATSNSAQDSPSQDAQPTQYALPNSNKLRKPELVLIKYIVKYGLLGLDLGGEPQTVLDFIAAELAVDEIEFTDPLASRIFGDAMQIQRELWPGDLAKAKQRLEQQRLDAIRAGEDEIRQQARDLADIQAREKALAEACDLQYAEGLRAFSAKYLEEVFLSTPDDEERKLATALASEKYQLSKVHTKYSHVETEEERLPELVYRGIMELKYAILDASIDEVNGRLKQLTAANAPHEEVSEAMKQAFDLYKLKAQFAQILGERIVNPR